MHFIYFKFGFFYFCEKLCSQKLNVDSRIAKLQIIYDSDNTYITRMLLLCWPSFCASCGAFWQRALLRWRRTPKSIKVKAAEAAQVSRPSIICRDSTVLISPLTHITLLFQLSQLFTTFGCVLKVWPRNRLVWMSSLKLDLKILIVNCPFVFSVNFFEMSSNKSNN